MNQPDKHASRTLEEKAAAAILERPVEVEVAGRTYTAAPPTTATLILVSEAVSRLPKGKLDASNVVGEALSVAMYCRPLGDIVATLILGAKAAQSKPAAQAEPQAKGGLARRVWARICGRKPAAPAPSPKELLSRQLLEELSPSQLHSLAVQLLQRMEIGDFFALTTFLSEINLLRSTKVAN